MIGSSSALLMSEPQASSAWMRLPDFITEPVLERLPLSDFIKFRSVCEHWRDLQQQQQHHSSSSSSLLTSAPKAFDDDDDDNDRCPPPSPWMCMPEFIAELVLERLPLSDFIKFAAVCEHWRHLQQQEHSSSRILALPWFLPAIPKQEDGALPCISLFEGGRCYNLLRDKSHVLPSLSILLLAIGTCSGWLVLQWDEYVALLNPVTGVTLILPPLPKPLCRDSGGYVPALSPYPMQVVFFVVYWCHTIFLFRHGDLSWFELHFTCQLWYDINAAIATTRNGELYCLCSSWDLLLVSTSGDVPSIQMVEMDKSRLPAQTLDLSPTLVQANNVILLLLKTLGNLPPSDGFVYRPVESFLVFKADLKENKWVKIDYIGDHVLFIHGPDHASFPAPHGVKGNSVYFSDHFWGRGEVFDIGSGKKTTSLGPLGDLSRLGRAYRMIVPNLS